MQDDRQRGRLNARFLAIGVIALMGGIALLWHAFPPAGEAGGMNLRLVAPGCKLRQTIDYIRCGHQVLRRVDAPPKWAGMTKEAVLDSMEKGWRMTEFAPGRIDMVCGLDLFCPDHWVLALAEDGTLGVYRNLDGFAMERVGDAAMKIMDESTWEMLARGLAFDSREMLEEWVGETGSGV